MKLNRNEIIGLVIAGLLAWTILCPVGPKRPFLNFLGKLTLRAVTVAPLFLEPPHTPAYQETGLSYNATAFRSIDNDGVELVDHGGGW